jgi:flagellin
MPAINTNISALHGLVNLNRAESDLNEASQRLSSGKKLNSAADDAAGLSIATRMTSQITSLNMAMKNTNDGISMLTTVESALGEISNMLQRMRELAVQSGNDINSGKDRTYLQDEINQFKTEISSISTNTQFNGTNVLDGTLQSKVIQTGMNSGQSITFSVDSVASTVLGSYTKTGTGRASIAVAAAPGANSTTADADVIIHGNSVSKTLDVAAAATAKTVAAQINAVTGDTGVTASARSYAKVLSTAATATYSLKINGTSTGNMSLGSTSVGDAVTKINQIKGTTGVTASASSDGSFITLYHSLGENITVENESAGTDLDVFALEYDGTTAAGAKQDLAAAGGNDATTVIGNLSLASSRSFSVTQSGTTGYFTTGSASLSSISNVDIKTVAGASSAIDTIDGALEKILSQRSEVGALQNRLSRVVESLTNMVVKTTEAVSRIVDADFAEETAKLTRAQVLQQAGTAMLAQANQSKQSVLALLQ